MLLAADGSKAPAMQAYMKTDQPFYGIQATPRRRIFRACAKKFPINSRSEYENVIRELWGGKYREEMYQALEVAENCRAYLDDTSWPLYEELVRTATNWDTLDWIAVKLISPLVQDNRSHEKTLAKWRKDENFWVRRASLLAHLSHKEDTNTKLLSKTILELSNEREFFIRKAIGWVLRDFSYTDPEWVKKFVAQHQNELSGLSKREALKQIRRSESA